jgi:hypothetical protein
VDADHAGHPAGRAAGARDVADRCVERDRVGLEAVEPLGLEQPEEPDLLQLLDRRLRDDAQALGLVSPVTESAQQVSDPVEHSLGHCSLLILWCSSILEHVLVRCR